MRKLIYRLSVVAMISLLIVACKKDEQFSDSNFNPSGLRTSETCEDCCKDSTVVFEGQSVASDDAGDSDEWNEPYYFNFCTGDSDTDPTGMNLKFESYFNSYVSGVNGWNVWYLPESVDCSNIDTVSCAWAANNASNANICTPPWSVTSGSIGMNMGPFCAGWYDYNPGNRTITRTRCLLAWKDSDGTPGLSAGDKMYVVCLKIEAGEFDDPVIPEITVKYKGLCCEPTE